MSAELLEILDCLFTQPLFLSKKRCCLDSVDIALVVVLFVVVCMDVWFAHALMSISTSIFWIWSLQSKEHFVQFKWAVCVNRMSLRFLTWHQVWHYQSSVNLSGQYSMIFGIVSTRNSGSSAQSKWRKLFFCQVENWQNTAELHFWLLMPFGLSSKGTWLNKLNVIF